MSQNDDQKFNKMYLIRFRYFFRLLGLDLVPRSDDSYEQVDVDKESTIDLYNIHSQSAQNIEEASVSKTHILS